MKNPGTFFHRDNKEELGNKAACRVRRKEESTWNTDETTLAGEGKAQKRKWEPLTWGSSSNLCIKH